jgi:electron transport complex protein RnfD
VSELRKSLEIGSSPHITSGDSVEVIMRNVVIALLPVCGFAIYAFGSAGALILATAVLSCMVTESVLCKWTGQAGTIGDWSAAVTGVLYGLTLPPDLPLWMVAVGGIFAIGIGKFLFGGLGSNAFNPALVGRAFLQAAFPQSMTHWAMPFQDGRFTDLPASIVAWPFAQPAYDAVTAATPLAEMKFEGIQAINRDLLFGLTPGSLGETCTVLIFVGGLYLVARRMMNWRIPASIFVSVAIITTLFAIYDPVTYPRSPFMLFSGGLMLGAMFMATDMVASPITNAGCWLYGFLIGALVVVIRFWRHGEGGGMNTPVEQPRTSVWSMYRAIVGIGALCALLIVSVFNATATRIAENQARFLALAVAEVLPAAQTTVPITTTEDGQIVETAEALALPVFLGYDANSELVGAVVTAEGMGYQDTVRVLYSYSFEQDAIVGFKVLDSKETPGLGDKVEVETEPHFVANFERLDATLAPDGESLLNPIVTVKQGAKTDPWQIDGITGATITSEAVGTILNGSANSWVPVLERNLPALGNSQSSEDE